MGINYKHMIFHDPYAFEATLTQLPISKSCHIYMVQTMPSPPSWKLATKDQLLPLATFFS